MNNTPMFQLTGRVEHVFTAPVGKNKDGQEYGGNDKVQLIGNVPLKNGEFRRDIVSLNTDQGDLLRNMIDEYVSCPVSFFVNGKDVGFYIPKGHSIQPVK
jgi:hypothetical protein